MEGYRQAFYRRWSFRLLHGLSSEARKRRFARGAAFRRTRFSASAQAEGKDFSPSAGEPSLSKRTKKRAGKKKNRWTRRSTGPGGCFPAGYPLKIYWTSSIRLPTAWAALLAFFLTCF